MLIVLQPILDIIAFWTASTAGTVAGYVRLVMMLALALYALWCNRNNWRIWAAFALVALIFSLHVLNGFRVGYLSLSRDLNYIARVAFMPVMAICFCFLLNDEEARKQVVNGLLMNAFLISLIIVISYITRSYTYTYGEGLGISGWVTSDNRCCHSDILSTLCVFVAWYSLKSGKPWVNIILPFALMALLITNATRACYTTLYAISFGFAAFSLFQPLILKQKITRSRYITTAALVCVGVLSFILYPYTPRAKEEAYKSAFQSTTEEDFIERMNDMGYDICSMTLEEKLNDPVVLEELRIYYNRFIGFGITQMTDRFAFEDVLRKYDGSVSGGYLGNIRKQKEVYASLIFDCVDPLTRFTGFEIAQLGNDMIVDMENDYTSIYCYYGYLGLFALVAGIAWMFFRILKTLFSDFRSALTDWNFCLLAVFCIQLGLAYFSGAMFRRPNASFYFALVVGLLFYATGSKITAGENADI